jgi:iron complex transport system ATP-binding protein
MLQPVSSSFSLWAASLSGGYGSEPVIHALSLGLESQSWLSIVGANGSGKSTLLRLLARVLPLRSGVVWLDGKNIHHQSAKTVAQQLAILPQQNLLPESLTVEQLVGLGRHPHHPWWQWGLDLQDRQIIDRVLEQTQLQTLRHRPVDQLSGGERQRAFLALTLAQQPQILLLDEPTTFLDIHHQLELLNLLQSLNQTEKLSIITVLHDLNLACRYSHQIALLKQGEIVAVGAPEQVVTVTHLRQVFGIEAQILTTAVGLQVCPLAPSGGRSRDHPAISSFSPHDA